MEYPSLFRDLHLAWSRSIRLVVSDAEMAVDAGQSLGLHLLVPLSRRLALLVRIHRGILVAVAALERVGRLHALPDARGELVAMLLEFFARVDNAGQLSPDLQRGGHFALQHRDGLARHMAV